MRKSDKRARWMIMFARVGTLGIGFCFLSGQANAVPTPTGQYTQLDTGEIQDNETGLIWQQADSGATLLTFVAGQSYCAGLALNGHLGWRLPSIKEISTLVDETPPIAKVSPAIDQKTFPTTAASDWYWSASLFNAQAATAHTPWTLNFEDGFTGYSATMGRARCVR